MKSIIDTIAELDADGLLDGSENDIEILMEALSDGQ